MYGKFLKGMAAGAIIGSIAGMFIEPELDRSMRKKIKRSSKMMRNAVDDMYSDMKSWSK